MDAKEKLAKYGQEQLLSFEAELSAEEKEALYNQIESIDFDVLEALDNQDEVTKKGKITPIEAMDLDAINADYENLNAIGTEAIKAGKVGAVLLAGGMGTRLFDSNVRKTGEYD